MKRIHVVVALLALLTMILGNGGPAQAQTSVSSIVINEIMQNPAAVADDSGEWFELYNAGSSDVDVNGWTIADNDIDSHVINNGGPLLVPAGGYLVLGNNAELASNGGVTIDYNYGSSWFLANGADEVVLIDSGSNEVDRVEYDGGPGFPDPTGASMSLIDPTLDNNVGANWCTSVTPYGAGDLGTPGAANDCQPAVSALVINEIMQNPAAVADGSGEWFELYNAGSSDVDVNGWTIADNDSDSHVINNGGPLLIPAGGYLVLGNNADSVTNGGVAVDYSYGSSWFLANGADEVVLIDSGSNEVDRVEYDDGFTFPDPTGASMSLIDPALDNNVGANWCTSVTPYGAGDLGTPGATNDCQPAVSALVINEIHADPDSTAGDANGDGTSNFSQDEFVEIVNSSGAGVDIGGWTLSDGFGVRHVFPAGTIVPADCSIVVFGGGTPTGAFGNSVVQTASTGQLGLNNGGDTVTLASGSITVATVSYGGEGGDNQSLTRDPDITGTFVQHTAATGSGGALFSPGTLLDGTSFGGCPEPDVCGAPATLIHEIQGDGATSPLEGQLVSIEGVVVGDFQEGDSGVDDVYDTDLGGFYVQEEDADADTNPETSEAVFVFARSAPDVNVGDHVRVTGVVDEFATSGGSSLMTELSNVSQVLICDEPAPMPAATEVTLPVADVSDFEHYEGMLVSFSQELVIAEYFNFDRFGEIVLTPERFFQPTSIYDPDGQVAEIEALLDQIARSRITLDDGRSNQNPDPAIHPNGDIFQTGDSPNRFRGGDLVGNATGVIDETFGLYRLQPVEGADYTPVNERAPAPDPVGGNLQVASFNVLNYFLTLDDGVNDICGPLQNQECRGADTVAEFERQRAKILSALTAIEADVYGLIEMENTTGVEPLADIVAGLNDELGAGSYAYIDTGTIGTDAIKVGIVYQPDAVTPIGDYAILDSTVDPRFDDSRNRPALAQTFMDNETGGIFTVVVNHLKSKGSDCGGPPDDDPLQGNCNLTRTLAAEALVDWLATDPTGSGDTDFLITGDLNAYDKEDPIDAILAGPDDTLGTADDYSDLILQYEGELAYSYVFDGQLGYLDHALASSGLVAEVTGTTVWHINADEPDILDYDMSFKADAQDALYQVNPYRSSDHDPVIVGLDLRAPAADVMLSPDLLWPPNHKYVTVDAELSGDLANVVLFSAVSDEPDAGLDEEDLPNDIVIVDIDTFDLRAERDDEGDGRTYTITYLVTDHFGDSTLVSGTVFVPHDQADR